MMSFIPNWKLVTILRTVLTSLVFILIIIPAVFSQIPLSEADFTVLDQPAERMMDDYLTGIAERQFAVRDSLYATFKTAADWNRHAGMIRDSIIAWTGPLPEKTPLNARITGRIDGDDYTIEKVIYESRPGFLVSGNLLLPKKYPGKRPAILNVLGHSPQGKARDRYHTRVLGQVQKGFVAFIIDGIGQGERRIAAYEALGPQPSSLHKAVGLQAFLGGTHLFNYMVWDAIRAVDYLLSRPEVDPNRIGCTGTSGGGMMTTNILPFESRLSAIVPTCNPNTWVHRIRADLATDHEQVFFGAFDAGIDPRGDPFFTFVPKPILINATTDDNLNPPRGVWALHSWLYKAYAAHGAPEKLHTTMVQAGHNYNREQREHMYAWFLRWLGRNQAGYPEGDFPTHSDEELRCTSTGDVFLEPGAKTPHDLVKAYLAEHTPDWSPIRSPADLQRHQKAIREQILHVLNITSPLPLPAAKLKSSRLIDGGNLKSFILKPETGILLPGVLTEPADKKIDARTILYLHDAGKQQLIQDQKLLNNLLSQGYKIFAVDLRGTGETAPGMEKYFWDFLAGRPVFGQRVSDILACLRWLRQANEKIYIWASGVSSLQAAMAAVIDGKVEGLVLEKTLLSERFEELSLISNSE